MANEITIAASLHVNNEYFKWYFQPGQLQVTQNAIGRGGHAQSIGTSEEVIDFGDITTNGYLILRNLDDTNYVTYGPQEAGSGGAMVVFGKLNAGEIAILRVAPTVVMMAQADTADVLLDVTLLED